MLPPGILAILNKEHSLSWIEIWPFDAADLILAHCCRYREANDTPNRNLLSTIRVESGNQPIEFILCRASVAFVSFPNQAKSSKRYAR